MAALPATTIVAERGTGVTTSSWARARLRVRRVTVSLARTTCESGGGWGHILTPFLAAGRKLCVCAASQCLCGQTHADRTLHNSLQQPEFIHGRRRRRDAESSPILICSTYPNFSGCCKLLWSVRCQRGSDTVRTSFTGAKPVLFEPVPFERDIRQPVFSPSAAMHARRLADAQLCIRWLWITTPLV